MTTRKSIAERFWAKVQKTDGCWLWTASNTGGRKGYEYGTFRVNGRNVKAHRMAYELHHGVTLQPAECVLHSCDNPPCVNPAHLRIGTRKDNRADFDERGQPWQKTRTHCPKGHPYEGRNLIMRYGRRHCRRCMRMAGLDYYQRNKAEITAKKRTGPPPLEVRRAIAKNALEARWSKPREMAWHKWYSAAREDMAFRYGVRGVPQDRYKEQRALGRTPDQAVEAIYDNMAARGEL